MEETQITQKDEKAIDKKLDKILTYLAPKELGESYTTVIQGHGSIYSIYISKAVKKLKLEKGDIIEFSIKKIGHREQKPRNTTNLVLARKDKENIVPNSKPEILPELNEYEAKTVLFIKTRPVEEYEALLVQAKTQWDAQNISADLEKVKKHLEVKQ